MEYFLRKMKILRTEMCVGLIKTCVLPGQEKARMDITHDRCHGISSSQHIHQVLR